MSSRVFLVGDGGHAVVLLETARDAGISPAFIVTPELPGDDAAVAGIPYREEAAVLREGPRAGKALLGVGSVPGSAIRANLFQAYRDSGFEFATLCSPRAFVAASAALGQGVQVMAGAVVQSRAALADCVLVNSGAIVEHDTHVGRLTHVSPGAVVCGGCNVGSRVHVGAGACVIQGVTIGDGAVIGANALIDCDVPAGAVVYGARGTPGS